MKTIGISEETHKELINLKLEERNRNIEEIIKKLIFIYKEKKFQEHSEKFRDVLKKNKKSFASFLKDSKKIREEIVDEWLEK